MPKSDAYLLPWLRDLKLGAHLCCLYEREEEHQAVLTPFLRQGLERGEKVVYIVDKHTAQIVLDYLRKDGVDVEPFLEGGQLSILSIKDSYLKEGVFDPDGMIALLKTETERALNEGYSALRITGEMSWALRNLPGSERLIEYESKLNNFFHGSQCIAICQYDRCHFPPELLLDVLVTHPTAIIGTEVYDNFYFMAPEDFLGPDLPGTTLKHRIDALRTRKRIDETLREKEEQYRKTLDGMLEGCQIIGFDWRYLYVNDAVARHGRRSKDGLLGRTMMEMYPGIEDTEMFAILRHCMEKRTSHRMENEFTFPDGTKGWFELSIQPISEGLFILSLDITERKRAEEQLRESERKYRDLVDNALVGVYKSNLRGDILYVNDALSRMFEYESPEEMMSIGVLGGYKNPKDREVLIENLKKTGKVSNFEIEALTKTGKTKNILLSATLDGDVISGMIMDITERKRAEEEMRGRLMKFRLDGGNLYLVKEPMPALSLEAFKDLLNVGYHGIVISRTPVEEFKRAVEGGYEFLWIAERGGEKALSPELMEIEHMMENLPRRTAVLFDRLDYLVFKNGFKDTLSFVQRLREHAYLGGHVVVLSIDPSTLGKRELRLLEKEALEVKARIGERLSENLLGVLRFIHGQNNLGLKPSYKEVGLELGISKPTVRRRIRLLIRDGYVREARKGRSKVTELTFKGRSLFRG